MDRFKHILLYAPPDVPVGPAMAYAAGLAKRNQGTVAVVDCMTELPPFAQRLVPALSDMKTAVVHDRQSRLDRLAEEVRQQWASVTAKLLVGRPAWEITREVLRHGHDLVVTPAKDPTRRPGRAFSGPTVIQLMRLCPCQIFVVDESEDARCDRVFAAIDPQTSDADHSQLNRLVLELAVSLAEQVGGEVSVVAAWSAFAASVLHVKCDDEEVETYVEASRCPSRRGGECRRKQRKETRS